MKTVLCILIVLALFAAVAPALAQEPDGGRGHDKAVVNIYNCWKLRADGRVVPGFCHVPAGNDDENVNFILLFTDRPGSRRGGR